MCCIYVQVMIGILWGCKTNYVTRSRVTGKRYSVETKTIE